MPEFSEEDLLSIQFHRSLNGDWYSVGSFRDKTVGKNGQLVLSAHISSSKMADMLALLQSK